MHLRDITQFRHGGEKTIAYAAIIVKKFDPDSAYRWYGHPIDDVGGRVGDTQHHRLVFIEEFYPHPITARARNAVRRFAEPDLWNRFRDLGMQNVHQFGPIASPSGSTWAQPFLRLRRWDETMLGERNGIAIEPSSQDPTGGAMHHPWARIADRISEELNHSRPFATPARNGTRTDWNRAAPLQAFVVVHLLGT